MFLGQIEEVICIRHEAFLARQSLRNPLDRLPRKVEFLAKLQRLGVPYQQSRQPGTGNVVINLHDPDGNRLHVDFPASDAG